MASVSYLQPGLFSIVLTAALILPLRFVIYYGAKFGRGEYFEPFPIAANLSNHRFVVLVGGFALLPLMHVAVGEVLLWSVFGPIGFLIGAVSLVSMGWSKSLYERNFYYDQWHFDMRLLIVVFGALSLVTPVFIPLFLVLHHVVSQQFDRTPIGGTGSKLGSTHNAMPLTMLLVLSAFTITGLALDIRPYMVLFLLLCGYGAHYFHSGIAKLKYGGLYYIRYNNPFFMSMNAYRSGWMDVIPEETVARIGRYTDQIKPLLNSFVLLIEIGSIFILFSYSVALAVGCLTLLLHLKIFSLTGDNFWQWMSVNVALIVGLLIFGSGSIVLFEDTNWFLLSAGFITLATVWMKPKKLGWLDSPYYEFYRLEMEFDDGSTLEPLNTVVFKPWEGIIRQGFSGHFLYLGTTPRTTWNWGDVHDVETHKYLMNIYPDAPDTEEARHLTDGLGSDLLNEKKTDELKKLLERFVEAGDVSEARTKIGYLDSPREQYHRRFPGIPNKGVPDTEPDRLTLYRTDGIWTRDAFHEIRREEIFSIDFE